MKRRFAICFVLALSLSLLSGCKITSPNDEEFRREFRESLEESLADREEDIREEWSALEEAMEKLEKKMEDCVERAESLNTGSEGHHWLVLDSVGTELYIINGEEQVDALDVLLNGHGAGWAIITRAGTEETPLYTYVFCQEKAADGDPGGEEEYEELVHIQVYEAEDVLQVDVLPGAPPLLGGPEEGPLLSVAVRVDAETAEVLRDPSRFTET